MPDITVFDPTFNQNSKIERNLFQRFLSALNKLKIKIPIETARKIFKKIIYELKTEEDINKEIDKLIKLRDKIHNDRYMRNDIKVQKLRSILRQIKDQQEKLKQIQTTGKPIEAVNKKAIVITILIGIAVATAIIYMIYKYRQSKSGNPKSNV